MQASPSLWAAALTLLWLAFVVTPRAQKSADLTWLACSIGFFAIWMIATNLWTNPAYTAAAPYHAAFLAGGFLLGRRSGPENAGILFQAALVFAGVLAGWALWQRMAGGIARAHSLFETPATLASTINLILLPGLVMLAWGKRHWVLIAALVLLSAALAATQSRGGGLALAIGGLTALAVARRAGFLISREAILRAIAVLISGWALSLLIPLVFDQLVFVTDPLRSVLPTTGRESAYAVMGADAVASSAARLELYSVAWKGIGTAPPLFGSGYLAFYYLLERGRQGLSAYGDSTTFFVHNDYLQTLLELGVPGMAGLLVLVILPFLAAWRAAPRVSVNPAHGLVLVALVASLSSMAAHALVDFPFYVPVCLLIFGTVLGMLDSVLLYAAGKERPRPPASLAMVRLRGAAGAAVVTLGIWTLAMPVAAETAAEYAQRQWRAAQSTNAAYWFEVARRLEPRDWRYHWYAGRFWYLQATQSLKPAAAELADRAFAAGDAANPREVRNLLGRIETHRELRALLATPADAATLRAWVERAVQLAPLNPGASAEHALVWKQFDPPGVRPLK